MSGMRLRWVSVFVYALSCSPSAADDEYRIAWRTGADFRQQLRREIGLSAPAQPCREVIDHLARLHRVAVFVDRRIDPSQQIGLSIVDTPLGSALRKIAQEVGADVCYVDPVVYIGPPGVASRLDTLAAVKRQQAESLPTGLRRKLLKKQPWRWDDLATPRELLAQLTAEGNLQLVGLEQLPHDLWPARDLPSLSLIDRLSLVLAGFSLTVEVAKDGSAKLVPLPDQIALARRYSMTRSPQRLIERIHQRFPSAVVKHQRGILDVQGCYELHHAIQQYLSRTSQPTPSRRQATEEKRYTIKVRNQPVNAILKMVAQQEGFAITPTPQAKQRLQERVSLELEQATLNRLLTATLTPAGLGFELDGQTLVIRRQQAAE